MSCPLTVLISSRLLPPMVASCIPVVCLLFACGLRFTLECIIYMMVQTIWGYTMTELQYNHTTALGIYMDCFYHPLQPLYITWVIIIFRQESSEVNSAPKSLQQEIPKKLQRLMKAKEVMLQNSKLSNRKRKALQTGSVVCQCELSVWFYCTVGRWSCVMNSADQTCCWLFRAQKQKSGGSGKVVQAAIGRNAIIRTKRWRGGQILLRAGRNGVKWIHENRQVWRWEWM